MAEQKLMERWKNLSRLQRWSIIAGCCLLFYTVFGFWILPAVVRSQMEKKLGEALQRQATVQEVKFNPYTLQAQVNGFTIQERESREPFVSFDSLRVNLQAVSLFKRAVVVKSVALVNPYCRVVFNKDRSFNFSDLAAKDTGEEKKEKEEKPAKPLLFSINNIDLSGGKVDFDDNMKDVRHRITDLHIAFPFLSNLPYEVDIFTEPAFAAVVNGTPFSMRGASKPFNQTRESEINLNFADIDLTAYRAYLPDNLNFIIKNGRLDLNLCFSFMMAPAEGGSAVNIKGKASLREIKVVDRQEQPLLAFPELTVDVDRTDLFRREFHVAAVSWQEPELYVQRDENGQLNLAGLVTPSAEEAGKEKMPAPAPPPDPLLLEVVSAALEGATIHFTDQTVSGPMQTTLQPVNLQVKNFSTGQDKPADYSLALTSESGENISVGGTFSLSPLKVAADLGLENIKPGKYRPYYENALRAEIAAEKMKVAAHVDYVAADGAMLVSGLGVELGGLSFSGPDAASRVVIPDFSISGAEINLRDKTVLVGRCASKGAVIPLTRRKDGSINLQDFFAAGSTPPAAKNVNRRKEAGAVPPAAWQVTVQQVDFSGYDIFFTDQVPEEPAVLTMNQLHLTAENLTTRAGEEAALDLDLLFNKTGKVKVHGKAALSPPALRLDLDLADLPLKSVQSYVEQNLNIIMTDGLGAVQGKMTLDTRKEGGVGVTFQGDVRSRRFVCLDGKQARKLLTWNDLQVKKINLQTSPMRITAREISFDGMNAFVAISQEGVMNLTTIARAEPQKESRTPPPKAEGKQPEVEIGQVRLANCRIDFSDSSIAPQFKTTLQQINGGIKGLSSRKDASANVHVTAKLDQHSPVKLTGSIHPWQDFLTDLKAEFSDIELSPASPYTIKFIGYPLTKGKLNLNLHYLVKGKTLKSENKAFIDQITLGDFVKNDTAVSLPVQLAVTLLKNRRGEIDLDIPVSGKLDDPEFSVGGVVLKVLYNLIVKAATSPFSLLGAIFEGGGEEQYVRFAAGQSTLGREEAGIVAELAKVLYDRPAIKVELAGQVDSVEDGRALTQTRFDRLLKVQKMKDIARRETAVSEVDAVTINSQEYDRYLKKAYKAADFERPRNLLGLLKDLPREEMEKLLYANIVVSENDFRNLAMERAGAVRDSLIEKGPVEPERIFLVEPAAVGTDSAGQQVMGVEITVK